jgi:hypothetical protein
VDLSGGEGLRRVMEGRGRHIGGRRGIRGEGRGIEGGIEWEKNAYLALELYLLFVVVWCVPFRQAGFTSVIDQLYSDLTFPVRAME